LRLVIREVSVARGVRPLYLECDRLQAVTCWAGIVLYTALVAWFGVWLALHVADSGAWPLTLVATSFVALFLADLISGVVHWATDTWFDEVLSERVISIAREHHLHPHHIVGYGVRDYIAYSAWPTLLMLGPIGLPLSLWAAPSPVVFHAMWTVFVISACMYFGTYAHRLGHKQSDWAVVRLLQRWHFLIDVRHHNVHHRDNHDIRYCVVNGWANHVCDRIGFWRGLEWLIHRLTGAVPRKNDYEWFARYQPYSPRRGK
jgi:ubiquitin-conjugating enzyme E2 variant